MADYRIENHRRGVGGAIFTHARYEKSNIILELCRIAVAEAEFRSALRGAETAVRPLSSRFSTRGSEELEHVRHTNSCS